MAGGIAREQSRDESLLIASSGANLSQKRSGEAASARH